jgi:hypothetical protein
LNPFQSDAVADPPPWIIRYLPSERIITCPPELTFAAVTVEVALTVPIPSFTTPSWIVT